jgi:hypothetical protein
VEANSVSPTVLWEKPFHRQLLEPTEEDNAVINRSAVRL